jgi:hypothetical protein
MLNTGGEFYGAHRFLENLAGGENFRGTKVNDFENRVLFFGIENNILRL